MTFLNINRGLYLELDLPPTGLLELENEISLPTFNGPYCEADHRGNQSSHFEAHFASQVALRRLCAEIHERLYDGKIPLPRTTQPLTINQPVQGQKLHQQERLVLDQR